MGQTLTSTLELAIRTRLVTESAEVLELNNIIGEAIDFSGREDFAGFIGVTNNLADTVPIKSAKMDALLVKYLMIYYVNFTDSQVAGAEKCPNTFLDYNLELFQENDTKNNLVSSHNNFILTILKLRQKFLSNLLLGGIPNVKRGQLSSLGAVATNIESRRVPGVKGHFGMFRIRVEVR